MQLPQHVQPVAIGEAEIEQHDVPALAEGERDCSRGRARLPELHGVGQPLQQLDQAAAH